MNKYNIIFTSQSSFLLPLYVYSMHFSPSCSSSLSFPLVSFPFPSYLHSFLPSFPRRHMFTASNVWLREIMRRQRNVLIYKQPPPTQKTERKGGKKVNNHVLYMNSIMKTTKLFSLHTHTHTHTQTETSTAYTFYSRNISFRRGQLNVTGATLTQVIMLR